MGERVRRGSEALGEGARQPGWGPLQAVRVPARGQGCLRVASSLGPIPAGVTFGKLAEGTSVGLKVGGMGPALPPARGAPGSGPSPTRSQEVSQVSRLGAGPRPCTSGPS